MKHSASPLAEEFNVTAVVGKGSLRRLHKVPSMTPEVLLKKHVYIMWLPRNTISLNEISDKYSASLSSQIKFPEVFVPLPTLLPQEFLLFILLYIKRDFPFVSEATP
jgi:hypothetical protein